MKITYLIITMFLLTINVMNAQNTKSKNYSTAISNNRYTFAESYSDFSYEASCTFKKSNKDIVETILNKYFDDTKNFKSKITWERLKNATNDENIFFVELKEKELKIKWNNKTNISKKETIDVLKKISLEIVNSLK